MERKLKEYPKQAAYATSVALNQTAKDIKQAEDEGLEKDLDRPTPFTKKAIAVEWSKKTNLRAAVFVRPIQAEYLGYQVKGGKRKPKGKAILIGKNVKGNKLNKFGNMPKKRIAKLLARPDTFSGTIKGVAGIWQRGHVSKSGKFVSSKKSKGTNIRLLVAYENEVDYKPGAFDFYGHAKRTYEQTFDKNFRHGMIRTLKTMRK